MEVMKKSGEEKNFYFNCKLCLAEIFISFIFFPLQIPDVTTMETTDSSIYIRLIRKYIFRT